VLRDAILRIAPQHEEDRWWHKEILLIHPEEAASAAVSKDARYLPDLCVLRASVVNLPVAATLGR